MVIAIVIAVLVLGSIAFHFLSPWWFTPLASNWSDIDFTIDITMWVTGIVFIAVNAFLVYSIIVYRHRKGVKAHYEPENKKLEWWLISLTTFGIIAMLTPGLVVWAKFVKTPTDAAVVEVIGQQWQWSFRFPGDDKTLGKTHIKYITANNPFGLDPADSSGQDDVLVASNTLHLPVNQPVKVLLRSKDVLHNFAVPQFRVKMDLVPGMMSYLWFTPTVAGHYEIMCEELCGVGHHAMRGHVVVEENQNFKNWLAAKPTFADTQAPAGIDIEAGKMHYAVCTACHGQLGEGNIALQAPKLSGQDGEYLIRQLENFKLGIRGSHKDDLLGQQMAAMANVLPDIQAIKNVVAYIKTFPNEKPKPTITGNVAKGRELYTTCSVCHGEDGNGIWTARAPGISDMNDWYIATQLKNFRSGIRGSHSKDEFGKQMILMISYLQDEESINDLVAYLNML